MAVAVNNGTGFGTPILVPDFPHWYSYGFGDVNGDGHVDLVVGQGNLGGLPENGPAATVELGNGLGAFPTRFEFMLGDIRDQKAVQKCDYLKPCR